MANSCVDTSYITQPPDDSFDAAAHADYWQRLADNAVLDAMREAAQRNADMWRAKVRTPQPAQKSGRTKRREQQS